MYSVRGVGSKLGERNKYFCWSVIQKQMLEAVYVIRIGDNPVATRAWNIAVVKICGPEKLLGFSSPVIFEDETSRTLKDFRPELV